MLLGRLAFVGALLLVAFTAFPAASVELPGPDAPPRELVAPPPASEPAAPVPVPSPEPSPPTTVRSPATPPTPVEATADRRNRAAAAAPRRTRLREQRRRIGALRRAERRAEAARITASVPARDGVTEGPSADGTSAQRPVLGGLAAGLALLGLLWAGSRWPRALEGTATGLARGVRSARGASRLALDHLRQRLAEAELPATRLGEADLLVLGMAGLSLMLAAIVRLVPL